MVDGTARVVVAATASQEHPLCDTLIGSSLVVSDRLVGGDDFTTSVTFWQAASWRQVIRPSGATPPAAAPTHLDARGLARVGARLRAGDLLGDRTISQADFTAEEKILRTIFGGPPEVRADPVLYEAADEAVVSHVRFRARHRYFCPRCGEVAAPAATKPARQPQPCPFCGGTATHVADDDLGPNALAHVRFEFVVRRELRVGDVLRDAAGNVGTVARIVPRDDMPRFRGFSIDVLVASDSPVARDLSRQGLLTWGRQRALGRAASVALTKVTARREEKLDARGVGGPYDSHDRPLVCGSILSDARATRSFIQALLAAGYPAVAAEVLSVRSDAVAGRSAAYEALVRGAPVPLAVPNTTGRLYRAMAALGVVADESAGILSATDPADLADEPSTTAAAAERPSISLRPGGANEIRSWSYGAVKRPLAYDEQTRRPVRDGLYCERIFGPERDWECSCGKYKGTKYKGIICDRCGVKVTHSRIRGERMGHINLAVPVLHPWFALHRPNVVAALLRVPAERVADLLAFELIVIDPGGTAMRRGQVYSGPQTPEDGVKVAAGGEAARALLDSAAHLQESEGLRVRQRLTAAGVDPRWLVLECIPVLPPDLRPARFLEGGTVIEADLSTLYKDVIERSDLAAKCVDMGAPQVIVRSQGRLLQRAVSALFDNLAPAQPPLSRKRRLEDLQDNLRLAVSDLTDKSADYTARAVAVPDPAVGQGGVGLPPWVAARLLAPKVVRQLKLMGLADTIRSAKRLIEQGSAEARAALVQAMDGQVVLLATDGHELAALEPRLVEGECLRVHPDDARRLGMTFAGELATVHTPLSARAAEELRRPAPPVPAGSTLLDLTPEKLFDAALTGEGLALTPLDRILLGGDEELSAANPRGAAAAGPPDPEQVAAWLRQAVDLGSAAAMLRLAEYYHSGLSIPQDNDESLRLTREAAARGHAPAVARLRSIEGAPAGASQGLVAANPAHAVRIENLELSVRARKALQRLGVATLGELTQRTEEELLGQKNFGRVNLDELKQVLAQHDLTLAPSAT
jgi:TPR repeat protein